MYQASSSRAVKVWLRHLVPLQYRWLLCSPTILSFLQPQLYCLYTITQPFPHTDTKADPMYIFQVTIAS